MIATSAQRVAQHTSERSAQAIGRTMRVHLAYYAQHPEQIDRRLAELDEEWDVERLLQMHSSALTLFGLFKGITGSRRWLLLPLAVQAFFLLHGVEGWCPPLSLVRRLGFRTQGEIEAERYALRALRGDFEDVAAGHDGSVLAI